MDWCRIELFLKKAAAKCMLRGHVMGVWMAVQQQSSKCVGPRYLLLLTSPSGTPGEEGKPVGESLDLIVAIRNLKWLEKQA